jgi:hypothetical protein
VIARVPPHRADHPDAETAFEPELLSPPRYVWSFPDLDVDAVADHVNPWQPRLVEDALV